MGAETLYSTGISALELPMNAPVKQNPINAAEQAMRRKRVTAANWSARMEGLGKQTPDYDALSELWITGQISREELEDRRMDMLKEYLRNRGH